MNTGTCVPIGEEQMTTEAQDLNKDRSIERRTVVKAAAWAAPVIAIAATAPLAAASAGNSHIGITGTNTFSVTGYTAGATGTYNLSNASAYVTNTGTGWNIQQITVNVAWYGPVSHTGFTIYGATRTAGSTFTYEGRTWTVVQSNANGVAIRLTEGIVVGVGTVTVPVPPIHGTTTLTGEPDEFNQAGTTGNLAIKPVGLSALNSPIGSTVGG